MKMTDYLLKIIIIGIKYISQEMSEENQGGRIAAIVITSLKIAVFMIFLIMYTIRIRKLDSLASNNFLDEGKIFRVKLAMVAIVILLSTIHIFLSEINQDYWMYQYRYYALADILGIIDYCLQLYIITRQHKKKSRKSPSVLALWCINGVISLTTVILVQISDSETNKIGIILLILKTIALLVLIILTCAMDQKIEIATTSELRQTINQSNLLPLMNQSARLTAYSNKLYIQFNREFEITMKNQSMECQFKIAVYLGEQSYIITKNQHDFIELSKEMMKNFPENHEVILKVPVRGTSTNMMRYGEEKQKMYENYLLEITKTSKFYIEPLMAFLNIAPVKRLALVNNKNSLLKRETLNSEDEQKLRRPFFDVKFNQKNEKIHVSNPQTVSFYVNKSRSEMVCFHHRLIAEKRLKMELISEEPGMQELVHFIYRVANSKFLWRSFAQWMCLGTELEDKVFNMFDFWNLGFRNISMEVIGHEIAFDREGNVISLYLLSIKKKNASNGEGTTLKKRFNEFVKLDKNVRKFIENEKIKNAHLPSLPPKFSPFGSKTSPKSRQVYFDIYIKDLIKIQGINHCIKLLQFLQVDNETIAQQFYKFEDSIKSETFGSMNIDELKIDRIK